MKMQLTDGVWAYNRAGFQKIILQFCRSLEEGLPDDSASRRRLSEKIREFFLKKGSDFSGQKFNFRIDHNLYGIKSYSALEFYLWKKVIPQELKLEY